MNKIKAMLISIAMITISVNSGFCASLDSLIHKSELNKTSTIAVSVKDAKSGRVVYQYNQNKLMNPASVLKIFTMNSAYVQLGNDFAYETAVYADKNNNLYLKLSADPSLTTGTLCALLKNVKDNYKKPVKDIVIDPTVIDNKQWGIGWMWDDDTNKLLPKYSPFSVNENKIDITIEPAKNGRMPQIRNNSPYHMMLVNKITNGNTDNLIYERMPWNSGDMTFISGNIKGIVKTQLPVDSPERHFVNILEKSLSRSGIKYTGSIKIAAVPLGVNKIAHISSQPLDILIGETLKNSNNFYSEMIFKTAAANYTKSQGTTEDAVEMLNKHFSDVKSSDKVIIVDGCGISRNDLLTADWATAALNKIYKQKDSENFINLMAKPVEGTLSDRLLNISLKVRAKTGTASGISSIAGYIDTKSKKKYSFAIFIQNHNMPAVEVKRFEDSLINEIYKM